MYRIYVKTYILVYMLYLCLKGHKQAIVKIKSRAA